MMKNFLLRLLTALVAIPLLILAINWHDPLGVWLWVFFAQVTGLREWMAITMQDAPPKTRWFGLALGSACAAALFWLPGGAAPVLVLCAATISSLLYFLTLPGSIAIERVAGQVALMISGVLYAAVLIFPLALFKRRPDGAAWLYICLSVAWLSDTGAYFAGRFLGPLWGRKLYAAVSPKKTVVGSLGGVLGSLGAVVVAKIWYLPALTWMDVVLVAVPANILGQVGDLCESLIKRSVGVKDSGALLPGHGGMLDRVDALSFAVPYIYAYVIWRFPV